MHYFVLPSVNILPLLSFHIRKYLSLPIQQHLRPKLSVLHLHFLMLNTSNAPIYELIHLHLLVLYDYCYNHHKSKDALNIFLQIPPKIVHNLDPLIYPSVPAHNLYIRHIYQTIFHYLHLIQLQILQHLFDICCFLYLLSPILMYFYIQV